MTIQISPHDNSGAARESPHPLRRALARALTGNPSSITGFDAGDVVDLCRREGVGPLLYARHPAKFEASLHQALRDLARAEAALEIIRSEEDHRVLAGLEAANVTTLVLKGAALSRRLYPQPHLRPREDTDLWVAPEGVAGANEVLRALGYQCELSNRGHHITQQRLYRRFNQRGFAHNVDLHWKLSNRPRHAQHFDFEGSWRQRQPLDGIQGFGLSDAECLAYACAHLMGHHPGASKLIWLYDLHLMLAQWGSEFEGSWLHTPLFTKLRPEIYASLKICGDLLLTSIPERVQRADAVPLPPTRFALWWDDLKALPSWSARSAYLMEHAFPHTTYMRQRYPSSSAPLPWLYAKRAAKGLARLFASLER